MTLDPETIRQLQEIFSIELEELLQAITDGLLSLEQGLEEEARYEALHAIFRAAHNLKGAARGVEIIEVAEISHSLESLFSTLKELKVPPSAAIIDLSLEGLDRIREVMNARQTGAALEFDLPELQQRLSQVIEGDPTPVETAPMPPSPPPQQSQTAAPVNKKQVQAPPSTPVVSDPPAEEPAAAQAGPAKGGKGEVIHVAVEKLDRVGALGEDLQITKIAMEDHLYTLQGLRDEMQLIAEGWQREAPRVRQARERGSAIRGSNTLPDMARRLNQLSERMQNMHHDLRVSTNRLGLLSTALQDDVRIMRMMPIATILRPLTRSVRDLSRELNKEVEFNISGDDVDMDRTLLRGIRDPLMHLLRNAIDHGIESAQIRQQRGKPERGRIDIDVESRGSQIVMRVRDDGGGIDVARLAEIARENKILSHTELDTMEREDLLDLIFRPGFSSKQIITNISGRGVGLDVVRSNLRALHGQVELETVQGQGSTFTLKLPMTLVTDHGLLVKCNNQIYAIPTTSVEKVLDVAVTDFIDLEASQAIKLNHKVIPTRRLSAILESNGPSQLEREHISVVVVAKGWDAVALIVDDVVGEREIVIKPFSQPLISVRNVIGGTLTGSGEVIMVLNPADLVDTALHSGVVSARISMAGMETTPYRILVADDSITTRMLEKNILQTAGYDVTVAVNGEEAWETLQHEPFDLVVTDVEMPITNGFELTERIKQSEKFQALPVIIVTSLSKDEERRRGIEAGADAYIVKGQFETMALLEAVGHLI